MARSFRAIAMAGAGLILTASAVFGSGAVANANPVSAVAVKAFNSSLATPVVVSPVGRAAAETALLDPQVPIIVLGARLNPDCSAPAVLTSRLETARSLALRHPLNPVVVTGGRTRPGCQTEAEYMRDALASMGVWKRRITMETNSDSTVENAAGTAYLAGSGARGVRAAVIVTSPTHTPRARDTYAAADNSALWLAVPSTVN
ncbi:transporter [Corynebacterium sp. HMSC055G02]|uniref:YdcF family protein n=1 Tax=Corynebacterium TaxID=1716 RepID=UPI0006674276|nr:MULTISPECIES: YdcF family protein [Corynebacterium]ASE56867.1 YdcF family protein [Corynebacterium jeikeium]KAA9268619.1 YdcF family protein [Corynebacterium amycolatum]MBC6793405.1 YdcF family protein [Corynebacterium sp. LK26]MBC6807442.1 YdcF family protein [Corynebacterium sp. LK30]MBC6829506.1 YdcF family protein [Corynebacterium sp. LK32]